ncbi:DUF308 domain-containing protein [Phaeodactylibacter xiamenensis]|uniref:DUF308 domain-containing protein n=1 Tax=Phaeodactylibacter xiamenensis TaxID=1524460 RepID=UPI0024A873CD|nr:DUF308 domain-containing protein [Phaeodactylibacter xiamenensis]
MMTEGKRLMDSREVMVLEGVAMLGLSAVALCYPMEQRLSLLIPFGLLLGFSGITRLIISAWFFRRGSAWRQLVQQSAVADLLSGGAALVLLFQGSNQLVLLLGLWLVLSGYFQIRRYAYLREQWPACTPAGLTGILSVSMGAFLLANIQGQWLSAPLDLSLPLALLGLFKIYAFIKLGQMRQRFSNGEPIADQEPFPPYSPLNLN